MRFTLRAALLLLPVLIWAPAGRSEPLRQPDTKPVKLMLNNRHRLTADGTPTTLDALVTTLDRLTGMDHGRPILLSASPSTPYGDVAEIMSRLAQSGYKQVMIVTPGTPSRR